MLIGYGDPDNRFRYKDIDTSIMDINTKIDCNKWEISYKLPLEFINRFFPKFTFENDTKIKCNFYKCGDKTKIPHFGCWNKITNPEPNFHIPKYFGELSF